MEIKKKSSKIMLTLISPKLLLKMRFNWLISKNFNLSLIINNFVILSVQMGKINIIFLKLVNQKNLKNNNNKKYKN